MRTAFASMLESARQAVRVVTALLLVTSLAAAAPPEIVPLRIDAGRSSAFFPPGTELIGLPYGEFEALSRAALGAISKSSARPVPRLLRARHAARWDGSCLTGETLFVVEGDDAAELVVAPWTPALVAPAKGATVLAAPDGSTRLRLPQRPSASGPPQREVRLAWQLCGRTSGRGWAVPLALPASEISELTLDLPAGWEPEAPARERAGPVAGTAPGRSLWTFVGQDGMTELRLANQARPADARRDAGLWCRTTTRIDVGDSAALANIEIELSPGLWPARRLTLVVDPTLDVIDVVGSAVDDVDLVAVSGSGSGREARRINVRLRSLSGPPGTGTTLTVRGLAAVPGEGRWLVPSVGVDNAVWTGGTTRINLVPSRVVRRVEELAGVQVVDHTPEPSRGRSLLFESETPGPVAALELRRPRAEASAEVRGRIDLGRGAPRLDARLTWQVERGRPHDLDVLLPRTWTADHVDVEGTDAAVAWHAEAQPDGETRLRIPYPTGDWSGSLLTVRLRASAQVAGGGGPFTLPRVRPVGVPTADESWVAWTEPGLSLQPRAVAGLSWIDPEAVTGLPAPASRDPAEGATRSGPLRPTLAWRWIAERAQGQVERELSEPPPSASVRLTVNATPKRLVTEVQILLTDGDQMIRGVDLGLIAPGVSPSTWRFFDATTGEEVQGTPLSDAERTSAGLSGRGPAWHLTLQNPQRGRASLVARNEAGWSGRGPLPLIELSGRYRWRGAVLVLAARDLLTSARPTSARLLDPEVTWEGFQAGATAGGPLSRATPADSPLLRRAYAYRYESARAAVELSVTALTASDVPGVIRDASLETVVTPGYPQRHRLTLQVVPTVADVLEVGLPPGTVLERILRDGEPISPADEGRQLRIPLGLTWPPTAPRSVVTVDLEYRDTAATSSDPATLRPQRPRLSLPCASLSWELQVPPSWRLAEAGKAWSSLPHHPASRGAWPSSWVDLTRRAVGRGSPRPALPAELARQVVGAGSGEMTLWEWFVRWDAGATPILVDRLALADLGLGPRSRINPRPERAAAAGDPEAWLAPLGLTALARGRAVVITSRAQASQLAPLAESSGQTPLAVALAVAWGSDPSDRFQSVSRWARETTPRVASRAAEPSGPALRATYRFVCPGWPETEEQVRFVDQAAGLRWAWTLGALVVASGLAVRRPSRGLVVASLGLAVLTIGWGIVPALAANDGIRLGLVWGTFVLAVLSLAVHLPQPPRRRRRTPAQPSISGRSRVGFVRPGVLGLAWLAILSAPFAWGQVDALGSILVLYLYDGRPDPARAPDRVVLRLADYQRLRRSVEPATVVPASEPRLATSIHRFRWRDGETLECESELELDVPANDRPGQTWRVPIDGSREITATLDGTPTALRIVDEGRMAEVRLDRAERPGPPPTWRRLVIRRVVTPRVVDRWLAASVEINPCATARIEAEARPDGAAAEAPEARGKTTTGPRPGSIAASQGPAHRVDLRWEIPDDPTRPRPALSVDAQYLWDALPAGDRLRARLTYRTPGGTSAVRLGLDPGTIVRGHGLPPGAEVQVDGPADSPVWLARFSPPLAEGATITLDVWRPRAAGTTARLRTLPRVEPLGVERFAGAVGFRRPPDWVGRLGVPDATDSLTDEAFVRAWKTLPDDPLTLAGSRRLASLPARDNRPTVETGPPARRLHVRARSRATLETGRVRLRAEAELSESDGHVWETTVGCPEGFQALHVAGDGLTDWSLDADGRLRLRFDGAATRVRNVTIDGQILLPGTLRQGISSTLEAPVPWLRWIGAEEAPGSLTIVSPTPIQVVGAAIETGSPPSSPAAPAADLAPVETTLTVPAGALLGRLRWEPAPPRVNVLIDSRLTVEPDALDWVAYVRYDVWGRPLDTINLRLPADWAANATVESIGTPHQEVRETRGNLSDWSIRPDRPVWGSQRLILRGTLPFNADTPRAFPELRPLGNGGVDSYLRIDNATRQGLVVEGSPGLQPIAPGAIPADAAFATAPTAGTTIRSYRVVRPGWTLRVARQVEAGRVDEPDGRPVIEGARADVALRDDGRLAGIATIPVTRHASPFLELEFGPGSTPLWASVNGVGTAPRRTPGGNWQVPLVETGRNRVRIAWESSPAPTTARAGTEPTGVALDLPRVVGAAVPVVVRVNAPTGGFVTSRSPGLRAIGLERVALEEAEWLAGGTMTALDEFDRGSRQDGEELVGALLQLGLRCRDAMRAAAWSPGISTRDRDARVAQAEMATRRLKGRIDEALRTASLDDYDLSARVWLGLEPDGRAASTVAPATEREPNLSVRPIGTPHAFAGTVEAGTPGPLLDYEPAHAPAERLAPEWLVAGSALAALFTEALPRGRRAVAWLNRAALAAVLVVGILVGGPLALVASLAALALGRVAGSAG